MLDKNYQIAKFYSELFEIKQRLDNVIIPLAVHVGTSLDDPQLFESMEVMATDIGEHLSNYRLTIGKSRLKR